MAGCVAYTSFGETASIQRVAFDPVAADGHGTPGTVLGGSRYLSTSAFRRMAGGWRITLVTASSISSSVGPMAPASASSRTTRRTIETRRSRPTDSGSRSCRTAAARTRSGRSDPTAAGCGRRPTLRTARGSYDPWSPDGSQLIVHEWTHDDNMFRVRSAQVVEAADAASPVHRRRTDRDFTPLPGLRTEASCSAKAGLMGTVEVFAYAFASRAVHATVRCRLAVDLAERRPPTALLDSRKAVCARQRVEEVSRTPVGRRPMISTASRFHPTTARSTSRAPRSRATSG